MMLRKKYVFWEVSNGWVLMPRYSESAIVDDAEVCVFKDFHELAGWVDRQRIQDSKVTSEGAQGR